MHFPPPLVAAAVGLAMYGTDRLLPLPAGLVFSVPQSIIKILIVAGVAIAIAGLIEFQRQRTTVNPIQIDKASTLVTGGIFRWTRNPMYLGMLVILGAIGLKFGNPISLGIALAFIPIINALQIRPEEAAMQRLFGDAFNDYCRQTRRWL